MIWYHLRVDNPEKHLTPKIGQYVLIKDTEGKILLLERRQSRNWSLPGGRLDKDDKHPIEAVLREIKEEIGLEISDPIPVDVKLIEDKWQKKYCVYFITDCNDVSELVISDEHSSYKWVGPIDIENMQLDEEPYLREVLFKYFNK